MDARYRVRDAEKLFSPSLLFFKEIIQDNIGRMIARAGSPDRLRPHVKTHKTREIVRMQIKAGVTKHKCATIAEAEMLAQAGAADILIAYPMVGPNLERFAKLIRTYPESRFSCLVDHPKPLEQLSSTLHAAGLVAEAVLDVDIGQHRTGIPIGSEATKLYEKIASSPGLRPGGLHAYDGHNHQEKLEDRENAAIGPFDQVLEMRVSLIDRGFSVPRVVAGGTPTFPVYHEMHIDGLELSPGTCVLNDHGYGSRYADLCDFVPAALMLTRVISRPAANRITLDLGHKAVAGDPPAGKRVRMLDLADCREVTHNEEHLVLETSEAEKYAPGDILFAMPTHICPTCALHKFAYVVSEGEVREQWTIASRDRVLTI